MEIFLGVLGAVVIFTVCWMITWVTIIKEDEHAVVMTFGRPTRVVNSGLRFVVWPFQYVRRFTTNIIELNFRPAGIITKADGTYGDANIIVETSMYFRWPEDGQLIPALQTVGDPQNRDGLNNLFEETVLDAFRSVGGEIFLAVHC